MCEARHSRERFCIGLATLALLWFVPTVPAQTARSASVAGRVPARVPDCSEPAYRAFDFWVGRWEVENLQRNPTTPEDTTLYETGTAAAEIHPVLGGCAIVEHWEGRLVPNRHVLGFSLRAWNPTTGRWHAVLNWPAPGVPAFFELVGTFDDGVADFVFRRPAGGFTRYRFSGIESGEPTWEGATADGTRGPWSPFWKMRFHPGGGESEPRHGRSRTTDRCPADDFRAYDFLLGDWAGEESLIDVDDEGARRTRSIAVSSHSILEGCAIVDRVTYGEDGTETGEFRVRSYAPGDGEWVQYTVGPDDVALVRWEGVGPEGRSAWLRSVGPSRGGTVRRMSWRVDRDMLVRETAISEDEGSTWSMVARAELRRR